MKKVFSLAAVVFFAAATFAQESDNKTQAATPTTAQISAQKEAANAASAKHYTAEDKAKQFTDQINKAVPLGKDVYDKVMKVNVDFQKKKEQITGGKKDKELTTEQIGQVKQQKSIRTAQLQKAMGKDLYAKWEAASQKKGGNSKDGKSAGKDSSED